MADRFVLQMPAADSRYTVGILANRPALKIPAADSCCRVETLAGRSGMEERIRE